MKSLLQKSLLALTLSALGLTFAATGDAQVRTGRTRPAVDTTPAAAADQLSQDSLMNMLRGLGYEPVARRSGSADVAHITLKRDDWTFDFDISISTNKQKIWFSCWFNPMTRDLNASEMAALLEANLTYGPAHFTYQPKTRTLNLGHPVDNRGVSADILGRELNYFVDTLKKTADLWDRN